MKNLFIIIFLLALNIAEGQQQRFNLHYPVPTALRNERNNSGIRTRVNYAGGNPAQFFFTGIGTSYNNPALAAPNNRADRMRFTRLDNTGAPINIRGYEFLDGEGDAFNSWGNGIAEVENATHNGGYVAVGAVVNNNTTGATGLSGNSDALFVQLDFTGLVTSSVRYDVNGGNDNTFCIRKSKLIVGGNPTWIMCGQSKHGNNYTECFVARVSAGGGIVWFNRYNFPIGAMPAHCIAKQLCEDDDENIYVVGTIQDNQGGNINGLAFQLTPGGAVVWAHNYAQGTDDAFQAVRLTADNEIVAGGFTDFGAVAPATHSMLIAKLKKSNGLVIFENILKATNGATSFTSKCYDIIETAGPQYFLAGPVINGISIREMMYKTDAAGMGTSWLAYNKMKYNVGFGLDNVDIAGFPGVAYFSSIKNIEHPAFSDSHIMETDYSGYTCLYNEYKPATVTVQPQVSDLQPVVHAVNDIHPLASIKYKYDNDDPCPGVIQANANKESQQSKLPLLNGALKTSPNPVTNTMFVQFNSLKTGEYQLTLTNMEGKTVLQRNGTHNSSLSNIELDMSSLSSGVYLLTVKQGTSVLQQKVVKQ